MADCFCLFNPSCYCVVVGVVVVVVVSSKKRHVVSTAGSFFYEQVPSSPNDYFASGRVDPKNVLTTTRRSTAL